MLWNVERQKIRLWWIISEMIKLYIRFPLLTRRAHTFQLLTPIFLFCFFLLVFLMVLFGSWFKSRQEESVKNLDFSIILMRLSHLKMSWISVNLWILKNFNRFWSVFQDWDDLSHTVSPSRLTQDPTKDENGTGSCWVHNVCGPESKLLRGSSIGTQFRLHTILIHKVK